MKLRRKSRIRKNLKEKAKIIKKLQPKFSKKYKEKRVAVLACLRESYNKKIHIKIKVRRAESQKLPRKSEINVENFFEEKK